MAFVVDLPRSWFDDGIRGMGDDPDVWSCFMSVEEASQWSALDVDLLA